MTTRDDSKGKKPVRDTLRHEVAMAEQDDEALLAVPEFEYTMNHRHDVRDRQYRLVDY